MNKDDAREHIRARAKDYLRRDGSGKGYICPICNSGAGPKGTGISTSDGVHFTCWAHNCFTNADIIDIIGIENGIAPEDKTRYLDKLRIAAREFNITIDDEQIPPAVPKPAQNRTPDEQEQDYTDFYTEAAARIGATDYMKHRGLSSQVLALFNIGYCENWRHPKAPTAPATPRIIIPTSRSSYIARDTRSVDEIPEPQKSYTKSKVGKGHIFNERALYTAISPIFITEGEIDAMSIYEVGGEAVALGGVNFAGKLLDTIDERAPAQPLILALDNDKAGADAAEKLERELTDRGIAYYRLNPYGSHKDANETLQAEREQLRAFVEKVNTAGNLADLEQAERAAAYSQEYSAGAHIGDFFNVIQSKANTPAQTTGFTSIDSALDGGLYSGLYVMGAVSSLGKTTLALQIADNIAASGTDVLFYSLEMARSEIMAKSISRHTIQEILATGGDIRNAKTTRGITAGSRYKNYNRTELELITAAAKAYGSYASNIYIIEGMGDIGVKEIREATERHIKATGHTPVIFVDYLQILAPYNDRATDKQNTDKAVLELKRISRDYNTPVFAISSLNRENYSAKINQAAFKESGAIEYSADVLIGLQFTGAGGKDFDLDKAKAENPRSIDFVILKQRNGNATGVANLNYYAMFNYYKEK